MIWIYYDSKIIQADVLFSVWIPVLALLFGAMRLQNLVDCFGFPLACLAAIVFLACLKRKCVLFCTAPLRLTVAAAVCGSIPAALPQADIFWVTTNWATFYKTMFFCVLWWNPVKLARTLDPPTRGWLELLTSRLRGFVFFGTLIRQESVAPILIFSRLV